MIKGIPTDFWCAMCGDSLTQEQFEKEDGYCKICAEILNIAELESEIEKEEKND